MKYLSLLLLAPLLLLGGCKGVSDTETVDTTRIENILEAIQTDFNNYQSESIIDYYHEDYLHDGDGLIMAEHIWNERSANYLEMQLTNIEIELDGNFATASFEMHLYGADDEDVFLEPYEHGDFSYFHKDNGVWRIYGNQNPDEGNNLYISSEPTGALIYLNDAPMHQYTPATLHSLPTGTYSLRLYKEGWNELEESLYVNQTMMIDRTLSTPTYPRPVFTVESPASGQTITDETVVVAGTVRLQDSFGQLTDFEGQKVVISVNGTETLVTTTGLIHTEVNLPEGDTQLQLRATGAAGNTGWSSVIALHRL